MAERVSSSAPGAARQLIALTGELVAEIREIIRVVGFWDNPTKQDDLRKRVKQSLDASDLFTYEHLDELSVQLVDLARANQHRLR